MYFKAVFRESDNKLVSICRNTDILHYDWRTEYIPREWVAPKVANTYLFCFESLYYAERFLRNEFGHNDRVELWTCQVIGKRKPPQRISTYNLNKYWEHIRLLAKKKQRLDRWDIDKLVKKDDVYTKTTPTGTILASKIKIIEKVS